MFHGVRTSGTQIAKQSGKLKVSDDMTLFLQIRTGAVPTHVEMVASVQTRGTRMHAHALRDTWELIANTVSQVTVTRILFLLVCVVDLLQKMVLQVLTL